MTPMHVHCPECRASLHLMVQLLPTRASCTRCHCSFTLNCRPALVAPPEPAPAPVAPPTPPAQQPLGLLRGLVALVLLAVLVGCGIAIVNACINDDPPDPAVAPAQTLQSPVTHHPTSQAKRFRGN